MWISVVSAICNCWLLTRQWSVLVESLLSISEMTIFYEIQVFIYPKQIKFLWTIKNTKIAQNIYQISYKSFSLFWIFQHKVEPFIKIWVAEKVAFNFFWDEMTESVLLSCLHSLWTNLFAFIRYVLTFYYRVMWICNKIC